MRLNNLPMALQLVSIGRKMEHKCLTPNSALKGHGALCQRPPRCEAHCLTPEVRSCWASLLERAWGASQLRPTCLCSFSVIWLSQAWQIHVAAFCIKHASFPSASHSVSILADIFLRLLCWHSSFPLLGAFCDWNSGTDYKLKLYSSPFPCIVGLL